MWVILQRIIVQVILLTVQQEKMETSVQLQVIYDTEKGETCQKTREIKEV